MLAPRTLAAHREGQWQALERAERTKNAGDWLLFESVEADGKEDLSKVETVLISTI